MLAKNCPVLMNELGSYKLVQELEINELFFDPMADEYAKITNILSKRVDLHQGYAAGKHPLCPIVFSVGSVSSRGPHKQVRMSPGQGVMLALPSGEDIRKRSIECRSALAISKIRSGVTRQASQRFVEYFAIFTEGNRLMDVGGLLVSANEARTPESLSNKPIEVPRLPRTLDR